MPTNLTLELLSVQKLWGELTHSAFTDLIHYQNKWFCTFREGSSHMSLDGQARVLISEDMQTWTLFATLNWVGGDVRDPKFSITPNNELLITAGVRLAVPSSWLDRLFSTSWLMNSQQEILPPVLCSSSSGTWRWCPSWFQGTAYSVGYAAKDVAGCLYQSFDGQHWQSWVKDFFPVSECFANESSLVFSHQHAYCLLRRDRPDCHAVLGISEFPFTLWQWQDLELYIGGPKMIQLSTGELLAGFRVFEADQASMVIYQVLPSAQLRFLVQLPSGGDCSYPGLVEFEGKLCVSYYSSHENQTAVYFAVLQLHF